MPGRLTGCLAGYDGKYREISRHTSEQTVCQM